RASSFVPLLPCRPPCAPSPYTTLFRSVLPEKAVGGDMHKTAMRTVLPQALGRGISTEEQFGARQRRSHRANFFFDERSEGVGDAQDQGLILRDRLLPATQVAHAGAGGIGDSEAFREKIPSVEQSVEGQIVQKVVGHNNQMFGLKSLSDRGHQLLFEFTQVRQGGLM